MRGEYLLVLFIVCNSGLLNARRGDTGSGSRDCRRTNRAHYRLCTKACSSDTDCGKNRKCLCDGDCGFSCVKNNLRCPVLPRPRNASQIISNSNSFRSVVTYTCKSPYKLRGSEKRTCRAIGKWDGKNAKCRIVCKDPGEITHGRRRYNGFQVGRSIFYWCFEGYVLKGSAVITCSKAGKWKNEKPRCVSLDDLVECNPPKMAEGAAILFPRKIPKKFKYNERVVLKCKNGYFKLGSGFQTCTRSGTWTSGTTCNPKSCGRPDDVIDGEIIGRVFTFKSRVNYTCHVGYELDGPAYRICQANERWSGSNPRCKVVDCGSLKTPDHGDVIEQVGTTFGKRIVFECTEVGYKLKGSDIRTCQSNGSWSGTDTTCELVECGDPGNPKNGKQVVSKGYVYGGSVRFECDKDYTITGQNTMYCQANGRWQGSVPECLAPCSDPGFPDQGNRIVEGFRHDQSVTFTCPRGYVMQGAEKIKCSNGRWSANKPSCKAPCPDPGKPKNGWTSGRDFTHGKSVRFDCYSGFRLDGSGSLTCNNGKWDRTIPTCKGICRTPFKPYNGWIYGTRYLEGDSVRFSCNRGYDLFGSRTLRCVGRRWDSREPECKARCSFAGKPANGYNLRARINRGDTIKHGEVIEYGCNIGFTMEGAYRQQCDHGRWSQDPPKCKADCSYPGDIAHGRRTGDNYSHGKSVHYACDAMYSLDGESRLTCNDGAWNFSPPECKASCRDPGSPVNGGRRGNDFQHDSKVVFFCNNNYRLVGATSSKCEDGSWNKPRPKCIVACPNPGEPANGRRLNDNFLDGETVTFECRKNYNLIGKKAIRCDKGVWGDVIPECKAPCNFPGNPDKGYEVGAIHSFREQLPHGSYVKYKCDSRYTMAGSEVLYCDNGAWNATVPSCKEPCSDPGYLQQGKRQGNDFSHGQTITFKCFRGFTLVGSRGITCNDGAWDSKMPVCKESCKNVQAPVNGNIHGNSSNHGDTVSFSCKKGHKLLGRQRITCADGKWSDSPPTCKGACENPGKINYGTIDGQDFSYGSSITFYCDSGYDLRGPNTLTCIRGVWNAQKPECKKKCVALRNTFQNGYAIGVNFTHGGVVRFFCKEDRRGETYDLIGDSSTTCQDGHWSAPIPSCQARCSDPGTPAKGSKYGNDYRSGAKVTFSCNPPLQLEGDQQITCRNGAWSGSIPRCTECGHPLGMEDSKITDAQISSVSSTDWQHRGSKARLHGPSSWCATTRIYLQINLPKLYKLTSIATQGGEDVNSWMSAYSIRFKAGANFIPYRESEQEKVIQGNGDATSIVKYKFKNPFVTNAVRIYPHGTGVQCLRTELYGCDPTPECILPGSLFWGLWKWNNGANNYYQVYITKLTDRKLKFELAINSEQTRTYNTTEPVLVIDETPKPNDLSLNAEVIARHGRKHEWYRSGIIKKIISLDNVVVQFDDNQTTNVRREELRLVKRPNICRESV